MVTKAGTQRDPIARLIDLVELDHDAIEAYETAIERLELAEYREHMAQFAMDHRRHVQELSTAIRELGYTPPERGEMKRWLTQGKVVFAGLIGDRAMLSAMKTNEDDTNTAYENALKFHSDLPEHVIAILHKNLSDERRHRAWLEERLRMEKPMPSSML